MEQSQEIEQELHRLMASSSRPLQGFSQLRDEPGKPFAVHVKASALPVAAELHRRFGDAVRLFVGRLSFPDPYARPFRLPPRPSLPIPDQRRDFRCTLDGPLTVTSGRTARHALLVTALMSPPAIVKTNGGLTAHVVDPSNGRIVGGFSGSQTMPLVEFALRYRRPVRIPLLVGTTSFEPALGYTLPAGRCALTAEVSLSDRRILTTRPLLFDIT